MSFKRNLSLRKMKRLHSSEQGLTIFEALVALALTSIILLTHAQGLVQTQSTYWSNRRNLLAMQQAEALLERFSVKNVSTLSSANNLTENNYLYNGMRFNRTVTVTNGSPGGKLVTVTVTPVIAGAGGKATISRLLTVFEE